MRNLRQLRMFPGGGYAVYLSTRAAVRAPRRRLPVLFADPLTWPPEDQAPAHLPRRYERFVWANSPQSQPRLRDILARLPGTWG